MRNWMRASLVVGVALALLAGTALAGKGLSTSLTGAEEVNSSGTPNQGDPDGSGWADLNLNQGQGTVCFDLSWVNISDPHAGHIHKAPAGSNGAVVVTLFSSTATGGGVEGCATGVAKSLVKDIRQNPSAYYVNVHNSDYPAGALRGQLGD